MNISNIVKLTKIYIYKIKCSKIFILLLNDFSFHYMVNIFLVWIEFYYSYLLFFSLSLFGEYMLSLILDIYFSIKSHLFNNLNS